MLLLALEICITFLDFVVVRMMLQVSTYKYEEIIHFLGPKNKVFLMEGLKYAVEVYDW